eukprot:Lithocolla_globosa_v1_NODE_804_length_3254_cov_7.646765.p4 type:complete len:120 gc:universal NODE_804_length_3254_cov_7.646765:1981-2340(+)
MSFIGRLRSTLTTPGPPFKSSEAMSGKYWAGLVSSASKNTPSLVILPKTCLSAEHETPMPTGHDAPCRGKRITRTSWQKYLPPNWAPMPVLWDISWMIFSHSRSLKARPCLLPVVGRKS